MKKLENIHPGEIPVEEFLAPFKITTYRLAKDLNIHQTTISEILKGNRRITANIALRLSRHLGIRLNSGLDYKTTMTLRKNKWPSEENSNRSKICRTMPAD